MANDERRTSFDIGAHAGTDAPYTTSVHSPFIEARKVKVEEVKKTDADEYTDIEEQFLSEFMEHMHEYVHSCVRSYPQGLTNQDKMHIARAMQRVIDQKMGDISSARARLNWKKVRIDSTLNATANDLFSQVVIEFSKKIHELFVRYFTFEDDYSMSEKKGISDAVYRALKDFHEEILFDVVHDIDVSFSQDVRDERSFDIASVEQKPAYAPSPVYTPEPVHEVPVYESKVEATPVVEEASPVEPEEISEEPVHEEPVVTEEEEVRDIHPTDTSVEVAPTDESIEEIPEEPVLNVREVPMEVAEEPPYVSPPAPLPELKREAPTSRYVTDIAPKALPVLSKLPVEHTAPARAEDSWGQSSASEWDQEVPAKPAASESIGSLKARAGSVIDKAERKIEEVESKFVGQNFEHDIKLSQAFVKSKIYELESLNKRSGTYEATRMTPADLVKLLVRLTDRAKKVGHFLFNNKEESLRTVEECEEEVERLIKARKIDEQ